METLFVYGTLQESAVQQRIIGRLVDGTPDTLPGYTKSTIQLGLNTYPILKPSVTDQVDGLVLQVTSQELSRIDHYETDAYCRVQVMLKSGKTAWVYVENQA